MYTYSEALLIQNMLIGSKINAPSSIFMKSIEHLLNIEKKYSQDYCVAYHAANPKTSFYYMVYTELFDVCKKRPFNTVQQQEEEKDKGINTWAFRLVNKDFINADDLSNKMSNKELFNDSDPRFVKCAICATPSIFTKFLGRSESPSGLWQYGESVSSSNPTDETIGKAITEFLGYQNLELIDNLKNLYLEVLEKKIQENVFQGCLFQIFIKKDVVDTVAYLSEAFGKKLRFITNSDNINNVSDFLKNFREIREIFQSSKQVGLCHDDIQLRILFIENIMNNSDLFFTRQYLYPICDENYRYLIHINSLIKKVIHSVFLTK